MAYDPWAGYMQGQQSLGNSLASIAQMEQHRKDQERANRLSDLQYKIAERSYNQDMDLERRLSDAQPRHTMSMQPTLGDIGIPGEQYLPRTRISDPRSSGTMGDLMPGSARLSIQEQEPFRMQPQTSPEVQAYHDGRMTSRTEQPDRMQIIADTRMAQGRPEDAFKAISLKDNLAQYAAKVQSGEGSIEEYYKAKQGLEQVSEFGKAILPYVKNGTIKAIWPSIVKQYPAAASMNPDDFKAAGDGVLKQFTTPDGKAVPGKFYYMDSSGDVKIVDAGDKAGAHNVQEIPSPDGKTAQKFQFNPETNRYDIPISAAYKVKSQVPSINVTTNSVDPAHQEALDRAVAEKRLDPYKINSRNRQDLARMAYGNPGIDLNGIAAEMGVARNKDVIMKSGIAEMIPGLLKETVNAGKALNYSDAQFVGKMQQWGKGQLNDPKLVEYMTLRNDQLLTLGGVMRNNGMTDMAQRLEEEAAKPTMSPRALEGWLSGQLKSIDPRLSLYRNLTKGNEAIPRSTYNPGDGAAGLLNGPTTPSAPKPGDVVKGYRFKGGNPSDKNNWVKQ